MRSGADPGDELGKGEGAVPVVAYTEVIHIDSPTGTKTRLRSKGRVYSFCPGSHAATCGRVVAGVVSSLVGLIAGLVAGWQTACADGSAVHVSNSVGEPQLQGLPPDASLPFPTEGDSVQVYLLGPGSAPCFSPDGTAITFGDSGQIYVLDLASGTRKRVSNPGHSFAPAWSPDGQRVVYGSHGSGGRSSIWTAPVDGGSMDPFVERAPEGDQYPGWSPDGAEVVWSHGHQLWIASSDGAQARPLTNPPAKHYEFFGDWSATAGRIAYIAAETYNARSKEYYRLWTIRPDGTDQALFGSGVLADDVKWSRDGHALYYSATRALMKVEFALETAPTKVYDWPQPWTLTKFDISPDETWLVYEVLIEPERVDGERGSETSELTDLGDQHLRLVRLP